MRGLMPYILAGILGVLAVDVIAPLIGFGLPVVAQQATETAIPTQIVDRTNKGDRLQVPNVNGRQTPSMPVGCEGAFSSLSTGGRANFPGRCLAERTTSDFARG
jgi:hypothetical protein